MPIPAIQPYPMPAQMPASAAGWRLDASRAALLIHDMQNYFVDFFPAGRAPVAPLLAHVARLRDAAHAAGVPVLYSAQPPMSRAERGLLHDVWGPGMGEDPHRGAIATAVAPGPDDRILRKWRYSAFHRTGLRELLASLARDQLVVCGVYAHLGCLMTVADAFTHDIEAFLVGDAVADFTEAQHQLALEFAAQRCAVALSTRAALTLLYR